MRKFPRQTERQPFQPWLESVPSGSFDQLQSASFEPSASLKRDEDAHLVALPDSRTSSLAGPTNAHPIASQALNESTSHARRTSAASPSQAAPGAARSGSRKTETEGDECAGSLWALEHPLTAPELLVPLPESLSSLADSSPGFARTTSNSNAAAAATADGGSHDNVDNDSTHTPSCSPANYYQRIAPLVDALPHLKTIDPANGRHCNVGSATCVDYLKSGISRVRDTISLEQPNTRRILSQRLLEMKTVSDSDVASRLILVEDLSAELIEALGSAFEIDPEFFAEHLNRSGYHEADYDDVPPSRWETHSMRKSHISMAWFRPVRLNSVVASWLKDPRSILDKQQIKHQGHEIVMPSSVVWSDPAYLNDGRPNADRMNHQAVVSTNIFRRSWPLSTRPVETDLQTSNIPLTRPAVSIPDNSDAASQASGLHNLDSERARLTPTAWQEKASLFRFDGRVPILIALLDPLPGISDHQTPVSLRGTVGNHTLVSSRRHAEPVEMALPMVSRSTRQLPKNKFHATEVDVSHLKASITAFEGTASTIRNNTVLENHHDPVIMLLQVVQTDTRAFVLALSWLLDEIAQDSLDDYVMTRRLADWRRLMSVFGIEMPTIRTNLRLFAHFAYDIDDDVGLPEDVKIIVQEVDKLISSANRRLEEAHTALRADMQFTESRRSINEAKIVTKLTELAFIFIPLSFTCSLFSMQINELRNGVPTWTFVVTAFGLAIASYGGRFIITSEYVADSSRRALERYWLRRNVKRSETPSVFTLLVLTMQEIWKNGGLQAAKLLGLYVLMSAFFAVPMGFLWTSTKMGTGFNTALTFLFFASRSRHGSPPLFRYWWKSHRTRSAPCRCRH